MYARQASDSPNFTSAACSDREKRSPALRNFEFIHAQMPHPRLHPTGPLPLWTRRAVLHHPDPGVLGIRACGRACGRVFNVHADPHHPTTPARVHRSGCVYLPRCANGASPFSKT